MTCSPLAGDLSQRRYFRIVLDQARFAACRLLPGESARRDGAVRRGAIPARRRRRAGARGPALELRARLDARRGPGGRDALRPRQRWSSRARNACFLAAVQSAGRIAELDVERGRAARKSAARRRPSAARARSDLRVPPRSRWSRGASRPSARAAARARRPLCPARGGSPGALPPRLHVAQSHSARGGCRSDRFPGLAARSSRL